MVLLQDMAGDDVVVKVVEDEGQVAEELFHEPLEGVCCISETKRREEILK